MTSLYLILADVTLITHVAFVLFVILGFFVILVGGALQWAWIRNSWFRALHLIGIVIVAGQSWFGIICPLTTLEMWLRRQAGHAAYEGSFVQYWLHELLYYDAPAWVFIAAYSAFGLLVLIAFFVFPPELLRRKPRPQGDP